MSDREKHLKVLEELRKTLNVDKGIEFGEEIKALDYGLNTMRKYQKIQDIVEAWKADVDIDSYDSMADICEVVEDGNDDN